jgi:hypothetical protein
MSYPGFESVLRRIVTGDDASGQSVMIVDGPPAAIAAEPGLGGLLEIWAEALSAPLDPKATADQGPTEALLAPGQGGVKVRWFIVEPMPEGVPKPMLDAAAKAGFARIGADHHMIDQTRHPAMHETDTLDIICLLKGEASLILEGAQTRLQPGQIVIQRGTNHAWVAHGGPALFLAILIDKVRAA